MHPSRFLESRIGKIPGKGRYSLEFVTPSVEGPKSRYAERNANVGIVQVAFSGGELDSSAMSSASSRAASH